MKDNTIKLTKRELQEPLYTTFGRIRTRAKQSKDEKLIALVEKLNKDLKRARVEENYFNLEKKDVECPVCRKCNLSETVNTFDGEVIQRVVGCDKCGWVCDFNAEENWRERLEHNLHYLSTCVKEGCFEPGEAMDIVKRADWKKVEDIMDKADALADAVTRWEKVVSKYE